MDSKTDSWQINLQVDKIKEDIDNESYCRNGKKSFIKDN